MGRKYISLILLFLYTALCFSYEPDWFNNVKAVYPNDKFISVQGKGNSEEDAKLDALAKLSESIIISIEAKINAHSSMVEKDEQYSSKSFINKDIVTLTSSELFAVHFCESFENRKEKKYYECVYIDREETFKIVSNRLSFQEQKFLQKKEFAETEKDAFKKILFLSEALSQENEIKKFYYYSLGVTPEKTERFNELIKLVNESKNDLMYLKRKNPVSIIVSGDYSEDIKSIISGILTENGFIVSKNAEYKIIAESSFFVGVYKETYSCTPTVQISVESKNGTIDSIYYRVEEKTQNNKETVIGMALAGMEELLSEKLINDFCKEGGYLNE